MTLHKTSSGMNSACLIALVPRANPSKVFTPWLWKQPVPSSSGRISVILDPPSPHLQLASSLYPCVPQVGFQKRPRHLLGLHTQLELILAGASLLLTALLLGCLVALGVQYHRGRWAHACYLAVGALEAEGLLRYSSVGPTFPQLFCLLPTFLLSWPLSKHLPFPD